VLVYIVGDVYVYVSIMTVIFLKILYEINSCPQQKNTNPPQMPRFKISPAKAYFRSKYTI